MVYDIVKLLFRFCLLFLVKVDIKGLENLPKDGPVVIVSNHSSNWDPPVLGVFLYRKLIFMAKEELFEIFFIGNIIKRVGAIPVKRGKSDLNAIRASLKTLQNNQVLCVFPEGTRSKSGKLQEFQPGATMLAYKGKAPVIPIALRNTKNIGKSLFVKVEINIGEPIYLENIYEGKISSEKLEELTLLLHNKVKNMLA